MIKFKNIQVGYAQVLLEIDDLALEAGRVYALIGRNGSGKSTLLKTIIGQLPLLGGQIEIGDHSINQLIKDHVQRAREIAYVASMFEGVDALTLQAYVALGRLPYLGALGRLQPEDQDKIDEILARLDLSKLAAKPTPQLSDGERQLGSLARAMVQDTPIMVLDEPASFLDYFNRELLLEQLQIWVQGSQNRTALFSSHDIDLCLEKQIPLLILSNKKLVLLENASKESVMELLR
jgi:iron complex transport system ATP-binding protein